MSDKKELLQALEDSLTDFRQGRDLSIELLGEFIKAPNGFNNKALGPLEIEFLLSKAKLFATDETDTKQIEQQIRALFPCQFVKTWESFLNSVITYDPTKDYICNFFNRRFPMGSISYIGARTGRGKTTVLSCLALNALQAGKKVYFVTAEESAKQLITRLILAKTWQAKKGTGLTIEEPRKELWQFIKSSKAPKDLEVIANPETEKGAVFSPAMETIKSYMERGQLTIFETFGATFEELKGYLEGLPAGAVVLIDYIQRLRGEARLLNNTRQAQIQETSHTLADIAAKNSLILICGAQFKRPESEKPNAPDSFTESSFREAGDIEQDGHILIGIGRGACQSEDSYKDTPHFYTCLKDREGSPDNGKMWVLAESLAWSYYAPSGNEFIPKEKTKAENKEVKNFKMTKG